MHMLHKNREPRTKAEKKFALSIYYKSPSTYEYTRRHGTRRHIVIYICKLQEIFVYNITIIVY